MPTDASRSRPPFRVTAITLFPALFPGPLGASLTGQALSAGLWTMTAIDIRDYGIGRHRKVDDTPAGGGPGMVMRADVAAAAIDAARDKARDNARDKTRDEANDNTRAATGDATNDTAQVVGQRASQGIAEIYLSPRGEPFTQRLAAEFAAGEGLTLLCGRFEGIDERAIAARGLREISIGDYVLSGGEIAAYAVIDACLRLRPGVLGAAVSLDEESFSAGLLEYPQYTRPRNWEGQEIPPALLSGDHDEIAAWRHSEAVRITTLRRPDLIRANVALKNPPN